METRRPGSVPPVRPTVILTDGNEEFGAFGESDSEGSARLKVCRLLSGVAAVATAQVSADLSSATLAAVGCPLPTFRLFAREVAGLEAPATAVLAAPLLGVEVKVIDGTGAETPDGGTGHLVVRARFAPLVASAPDVGAALAILACGGTHDGFVRTGYLAQWAQPGRMWLWPDPGDGKAGERGGWA